MIPCSRHPSPQVTSLEGHLSPSALQGLPRDGAQAAGSSWEGCRLQEGPGGGALCSPFPQDPFWETPAEGAAVRASTSLLLTPLKTQLTAQSPLQKGK